MEKDKKKNIFIIIMFAIFFTGMLFVEIFIGINKKCEILIGTVQNVYYDSGYGAHYWTGQLIDQYGERHTYTTYHAVVSGDKIISKSFGCGGAINQPF